MWKLVLLALLAAGRPAARPPGPCAPAPKVTAFILHKRAESVGLMTRTPAAGGASPLPVGPEAPRDDHLGRRQAPLHHNYGVDRFSDVATGANAISIVNLATLKKEATIDLGRYHRPHGIERGHSGGSTSPPTSRRRCW
jgi:hypothetical protein